MDGHRNEKEIATRARTRRNRYRFFIG